MHRIPQRQQLESVLEAAMQVDAAIGGSVQLLAPDRRTLDLFACRGLTAEFAKHFATTRQDNGSACAQAMSERRRVVIRDVEADASFKPHLEIAAACGFRAVQSSPLIDRERHLVGMLSTHFAAPHHPSTASLKELDRCCRVGALLLEAVNLQETVAGLDRELGIPYRALSPGGAHAADAARMLLPLLGQDHGQTLLAKVESNLETLVTELTAMLRRLRPLAAT